MELEVQNKIVSAITRVIKKRGWAMYDETTYDHDYNPLYLWDGNIKSHDLTIHHPNYHPKYGFIIYRGHFWGEYSTNTDTSRKSVIDRKILKKEWNKDQMNRIKYDNYLINILADSLLKIKKRYNLRELKISLSHYNFVQINDNNILTYSI